MEDNYKRHLYQNYYASHTSKLYGDVSIDSIKKQFTSWRYYFGEYLKNSKSKKILDAGCGNGGFVHWLLEMGYEGTKGIDISNEMIKVGQNIGIKNIYCLDISEHLGENKKTYDLIFCRDVLEHFSKTEVMTLFELLSASLTDSGKLIIQVPNGYSPNCGKIFYSDFTHETLFTEHSLRQITLMAGFKALKVKEVTPVPHGLFSIGRFMLWKLLRVKYKINQLIETGDGSGFFSQNIIAEISK